LKCLSRVMGNSHARFLGGLGLATASGYPTSLESMCSGPPWAHEATNGERIKL